MKNKNYITRILLIIILITIFILPFLASPLSATNGGFYSGGVAMDLILVIDESGSMRQNDPGNARINAAKLFVQLNEILTEGNRVSVVGFGEQTNIYIEPTEIGKNKPEIMEAISSIKSNQNLTDMKLALEEVKSMLDDRAKKSRTVVIFLTDGDLGIDDIPIPDEIREGSDNQKEKPKPPSKEDGSIESNGNGSKEKDSGNEDADISPITDPEAEDSKPESSEDRLNEYLEDYKTELLNLCYQYQEDKIQIFPIAFTQEANIDILEQIADITQARLWKAETASDIRDIYLDIFKYITNAFIATSQQEKGNRLTGEIMVDGYVGKMIVIAVSNEDIRNPDIKFSAPTGSDAQTIEEIKDLSYIFKVVENPAEGLWGYEINGDMVLAMDLVQMSLLDPVKAVYFIDSEVPVIVQLSRMEEVLKVLSPSDFELSCKIKYPDMSTTSELKLLDDGQGADDQKSDGIFSYLFDNVTESGNYEIEFTINHIPTGSSSLKEVIFTVTDYQPVKKDIYLKIENDIIAGSPTKIYANFEDFSEGKFSYTITKPDGSSIIGSLLDNGGEGNIDQAASDGIYSNILEGLSEIGEYKIEIRGDYLSSEGYDLSQIREAVIGKYLKVGEISEILEADEKTKTLLLNLNIESIYDQNLTIGLDSQKIEAGTIEKIEIGDGLLEAGTEKDIGVLIYLDENLEEGDYDVVIPLVFGNVFQKDIGITFTYAPESFVLDLKTLIGLIIIFISLIPLVFLLYTVVNLQRLGISLTHPRIIVEFALFLVFLIAGIIVIFI